MTSWYSRILTTTSSSISNLQSRILQSENDGDTEDDTHAPPPVAPVYVQPQSQVGSRYGAMGQQQQQAGPAGSLSSLWDSNPAAPRQDAPQSLRQGRGAQPAARASPFTQQQQSLGGDQGRPVAGQRAGSYQATSPYQRETASAAGGAGGASAQDRLKQRLWGGSRTTSPSGGQGPFQPPPPSGGGGGSGDYEDRFAPGGSYDSGSRGGGGGGRPYVGANAPWSNADEGFQNFSGGGGGGGGGGGRPGGTAERTTTGASQWPKDEVNGLEIRLGDSASLV